MNYKIEKTQEKSAPVFKLVQDMEPGFYWGRTKVGNYQGLFLIPDSFSKDLLFFFKEGRDVPTVWNKEEEYDANTIELCADPVEVTLVVKGE